jgi:3-phosphoglycerate kinase
MSAVKNINHLISAHNAGTLGGDIVLVRADLNVPLDDDGKVRDATRLTRLLPTLTALSQAGLRVGVLSHFGRPKGQVVAEMSLAPIAEALSELLSKPVAFAADCIGAAAEHGLTGLAAGGVCVLENTRFHAGEEADDADFAEAWPRRLRLMSMMRFPPPIAPMPQPMALPNICRPIAAWPCRLNWTR